MNTKLLMTTSSIIFFVLGICLTFFPEEILGLMEVEVLVYFQLLLQVIGALFFSFGMLNWMVKSSIIGGIYNRPICIANFSYYLISGLALIKSVFSYPDLHYLFLGLAVFNTLFAVLFGLVLFGHPLKEQQQQAMNIKKNASF